MERVLPVWTGDKKDTGRMDGFNADAEKFLFVRECAKHK
jgi:hypothetical protein